MAWKMDGSPKVRKLTRSLAEKYSGMNPAPHDRPLSARRCDVLKCAFENQKFRTCEWAEAYCKETKETYRINGKHTSTVLTQLNGSIPKNLTVVVEKYTCDTMQDVADLYTTFDTRSAARSSGDINRIYAAICPELDNVNGRVINLSITSMSYHFWEDNYSSQSPENRAKLIVENTDFALFLQELAEGKSGNKHRHIMRGPVGAAIYATFKKSRAEAKKFWLAVRDGSGSKASLPDRILEKYLLTTGVRNGRGSVARADSNHEMYVRCIHAWNAWRSGGKTALRYYQGCETPAAV